MGGGVQYISLTRTTNLAYLDAKEWTNMYFEPLISVKCCPKLHIKQLRNNLHYICLWDRVGRDGGGGGSQMKRGGPGKGEGQDPLTPTSGDAYAQWGKYVWLCINEALIGRIDTVQPEMFVTLHVCSWNPAQHTFLLNMHLQCLTLFV